MDDEVADLAHGPHLVAFYATPAGDMAVPCAFAERHAAAEAPALTRLDEGGHRWAVNTVFAGAGHLSHVDGETWPFGPDHVLLFFPQRARHVVVEPQPYCEAYFAFPQVLGRSCELAGLVDPARPVWRHRNPAELRHRSHTLYRSLAARPQLPWAHIVAQLLDLLAGLEPVPASRRAETPVWLPQACRLLRNRLAEDVPLEDFAAELGIGVETFRKTFARHLGMAPGHYRTQRRIELAKQLLDRRSVAETAAELGYASPKAFARQFKLRTGCTPSEWARRERPLIRVTPVRRA